MSAFVSRRVVADLLPEIPTGAPASVRSPGSRQGVSDPSRLSRHDGYATDPVPQLAALRAPGVLSDAEDENAKGNAL